MKLSDTQLRALEDLTQHSPRLLLGTPVRELQELESAGYITIFAPTISETGYEITDAGRQALGEREGPPETSRDTPD